MANITLVKTINRKTPTAIDKLMMFIFGINPPAPYDETRSYKVGDYMYIIDEDAGIITFYQCIKDTSGPLDMTCWREITDISSASINMQISETEPIMPNVKMWVQPISYDYADVEKIVPEMNPEKIVCSDTAPYTITGLANTAATIDDPHFNGKFSLPRTYKGEEVVAVEIGAFKNVFGLTHLTIPNNIISIGSNAFKRDEDVEIPEELKLKSISFGYGIYNIPSSAFENQDGLTTLEIPASIDSISENAFANCTSLTDVTFRNRYIEIDATAFTGCTTLTTIYGYSDSTAHEFAINNSLEFIPI
jgi:hypothetical protein